MYAQQAWEIPNSMLIRVLLISSVDSLLTPATVDHERNVPKEMH